MADTQKNKKFYIAVDGASSTTPLAFPNEVDLAGFQAIEHWLEVKKVGSIGEMGTTTNILTYDTLDTSVSDKGKGTSNAGDPEIEVARVYNDPGQIAMRAAAETNFKFCFRVESSDAPGPGFTNTMAYNRGMVAGPRDPNGRVEDFELEIYTLALVQKQIKVNPEAIGS